MGASVDRIEPIKGDLTRFIPPLQDGVGVYFRCFSKGKRSMALDFRHPLAAELIRKLIPNYDVVVEGFKPNVLEAMGLAPDDLLKINPQLIVARLSGYGQTGPWSNRPGHDLNYLSITGVLSAQAQTSKGISIPAVQIADMCGSLTGAMSICAALVKRFRFGVGQVLDISLTDSALALAAPVLAGAIGENRGLRPGEEVLSGGASFYRNYCCSDGGWVAVGAIEPKFQKVLIDSFGSLKASDLERGFLTQTSTHWEEAFGHACVTRVRDAHEVLKHPQLLHRKRVVGTDINPPVGLIEGELPKLGEHGADILKDSGLPFSEIERYRREGLLL